MHGNGLARTPCLSIPLTFSLGYTFRKPNSAITRQSLAWNPQGKRNREGQPHVATLMLTSRKPNGAELATSGEYCPGQDTFERS